MKKEYPLKKEQTEKFIQLMDSKESAQEAFEIAYKYFNEINEELIKQSRKLWHEVLNDHNLDRSINWTTNKSYTVIAEEPE